MNKTNNIKYASSFHKIKALHAQTIELERYFFFLNMFRVIMKQNIIPPKT